MKFLILAALASCICFALGQIDIGRSDALIEEVKDTPLYKTDPKKVDDLVKKVRVKGCGVNLCFALDGSKSLKNDFQTQKDFIKLIGAIVGADKNSQFAATIYGLVNQNISKLTKNAAKFLIDVCDAPFPNAPVTFVSAGLGFCFNQLDDKPVQDDVNKIVLLGDGQSNFGDLYGPLADFSIAQQWRDLSPNNALCAVAVGDFPSFTGLNEITGDPALVLKVSDWIVLLNILDDLVEQICFRDVVVTKYPPTTKPHTTKPHTTKPKKCPCKCKSHKKATRHCNKPHLSHCKVVSCDHHTFKCCH